MDDLDQYIRKDPKTPNLAATDDLDQYIRKPAKDEPGWFEPGSKSETIVRNIGQNFTLGQGDEINAGIRSFPELFQSGGVKKYLDSYRQLQKQEETANRTSNETNPKTALATNLAAAVVPGTAMIKAGKAAAAIPALVSRYGAGGAAARGAGTTGALMGGVRGAGEATSEEPLLPAAAKQAGIEGAFGAIAPGVDSALGRFVQNYKGLRPGITGSIGPVTVGAGLGAAGGASGVLPPIRGVIGDPRMTRQETWSSDPYSKAVDTIGYGLVGALGGKGVKEMGRVGGAIEKTIAGEGVPGGVYSTPKGPMTPGGGGMGGGDAPPPKGPKAPEGLSADDARKDGMNKAANPKGRSETNSTSPIRDALGEVQKTTDAVTDTSKSFRGLVDELGKWRTPSVTPNEPTPAPKPQPEGPTEWPRIFTPDELDQDLTAETLKGMPASKGVIPRPPVQQPPENDSTEIQKLLQSWGRGQQLDETLAPKPPTSQKPPGVIDMSEYRAPGTSSADESMDALADSLKRVPIETLVNQPHFGTLMDSYRLAKKQFEAGHPAITKALEDLNTHAQSQGYRDIQHVQEMAKGWKK